jgi:aminoglycoside phosphotransferase (APT) family kinase protein
MKTELNMAGIEAWMRANVQGFSGPIRIEKFSGGQSNPTFRISAADREFVLRSRPTGDLLRSAHRVDREYRVLKALQDTAVPVPRVHAHCEDTEVIGAAFYIMDYVDGEIFWDQLMPNEGTKDRARHFDSMNSTIAAIHSIDFRAVGLEGFGHPGNYLSRQIQRFTEQYRSSCSERIKELDQLIDWLPRHLPPERMACVIHGDFKVDNLVFDRSAHRVAAVLDWELSTLGDPLADFSYHAMAWYLEPNLFRGFAGAATAASGIPALTDYVAAYERRTSPIPGEHWRFYIVFSMFRLASILHGISQRAHAGTAADADAALVGRKAAPVAARAWQLANTEGSLL